MTTLQQLTEILNSLADQLRVLRLEPHVIEAYHEKVGKKSMNDLIRVCKHLRENYKPVHTKDFPVLAVFAETFHAQATPYGSWDCRCCGIPFPAGQFHNLRCDCVWNYCYECGQCAKHCDCEKLSQLSDSQAWKNVLASLDSPIKKAFLEATTGKTLFDVQKTSFKPLPELPNIAWEQAKRHYEARGFKIWRRGEEEPKV